MNDKPLPTENHPEISLGAALAHGCCGQPLLRTASQTKPLSSSPQLKIVNPPIQPGLDAGNSANDAEQAN